MKFSFSFTVLSVAEAGDWWPICVDPVPPRERTQAPSRSRGSFGQLADNRAGHEPLVWEITLFAFLR